MKRRFRDKIEKEFENGGTDSMGSYLNPGSDLFEMALQSQIFVDKSGLIEKQIAVCGHSSGICA